MQEEQLTPWEINNQNHLNVIRKPMNFLNDNLKKLTMMRERQQTNHKQTYIETNSKPFPIPLICNLKQKKNRVSQSEFQKKKQNIRSVTTELNTTIKPIFLLPQLSLYRSKFPRKAYVNQISNFQRRYLTKQVNKTKYFFRTTKYNSEIQQKYRKSRQNYTTQIQQHKSPQKGIRKYNLFKK